jgi:hypothetical protein
VFISVETVSTVATQSSTSHTEELARWYFENGFYEHNPPLPFSEIFEENKNIFKQNVVI